MTVNLDVGEDIFNETYVMFGLFHAHPKYFNHEITDGNGGAPFHCFNEQTWFRKILVPSQSGPIPINGCLVKLHQRKINLSFQINSTDAKSK